MVTWTSRNNYYNIDLDPNEFIDCENEHEVRCAVTNKIWDMIDEAEIDPVYNKVIDLDYNLTIPEEFYNEIKELRNGK